MNRTDTDSVLVELTEGLAGFARQQAELLRALQAVHTCIEPRTVNGPTLRRDYDFFTELDAKLARLGSGDGL